MAIPSNPLVTDLVTEGIKQAGEFNPSTALLTRAQTEWMEEIKNDIWHLAKKPKVLHVTAYAVMPQGQSRYAYPSDFSSDLNLSLLYGTNQGAAQTGSVNSITLAATNKSGQEIVGREIMMMAGTSTGSWAQIVTYNATTKVASVVPNFATAPVVADTYMIVDYEYPIEVRPIFDREGWFNQRKFAITAQPKFAYPLGDSNEGYFVLDTAPDIAYGMRLRYYADLTQVDTASPLMSTIYRRWRNIFVEGIRAKKLNDEDDDRATDAISRYRQNLLTLIYREIYGMDLSNITDRISDYW